MLAEVLGGLEQERCFKPGKERLRNIRNGRDRAALTFRKILAVDVLYIRQLNYCAANLANVRRIFFR